jgi:hypothetical protein
MGILSMKLPKLPDRTVVFLSALYFWAYMMFYFTKIVNVSIGFILRHTPDAFIIYKSGGTATARACVVDIKTKKTNTSKKKSKINIIQAIADNIPITNKLKNLVQRTWDDEIGEDENGDYIGGIKVDDILSFVKSPIVWISYLFEFDKKLSDMSDAEIGNAIKTILVDFGDKSIYRNSDLSQKEPLLFGEIPIS